MEEAQKELDHFRKDTRWYNDHYEELLENYPDHWVAVYDQELVAASPDEDEMFAELKRKGVLATKAYITFLTTKDEIWIFPVA
jgi:hypothetical protein